MAAHFNQEMEYFSEGRVGGRGDYHGRGLCRPRTWTRLRRWPWTRRKFLLRRWFGSSHASCRNRQHALQRDALSGYPGLNYHMNYHNFEIGPGNALDTGQEPGADHALFASLAH